ncbi:MAG TPA: hypothetical protein PKH79_04200 [Prolixibacteraceae bacterium]|nr:hypothetical protein [Prolixibacteraceae bacterium]
MGVSWINYGGKKLLFVDYNGAKKEDEMLKILYEEIEILRNEKERQYILVNVGNSFSSEKYKQEVQRLTKEVVKYKAEKSAIVGMVGLKKFIFSAMITLSDGHVRLFDTEEDAKKWLVS